jgi:hypothetical protein
MWKLSCRQELYGGCFGNEQSAREDWLERYAIENTKRETHSVRCDTFHDHVCQLSSYVLTYKKCIKFTNISRIRETVCRKIGNRNIFCSLSLFKTG